MEEGENGKQLVILISEQERKLAEDKLGVVASNSPPQEGKKIVNCL